MTDSDEQGRNEGRTESSVNFFINLRKGNRGEPIIPDCNPVALAHQRKWSSETLLRCFRVFAAMSENLKSMGRFLWAIDDREAPASLNPVWHKFAEEAALIWQRDANTMLLSA